MIDLDGTLEAQVLAQLAKDELQHAYDELIEFVDNIADKYDDTTGHDFNEACHEEKIEAQRAETAFFNRFDN